MKRLNTAERNNTVFLLSIAVDRLFLELLKYQSVTEIDPDIIKVIQEAAESASNHFADMNMLGGEEF